MAYYYDPTQLALLWSSWAIQTKPYGKRALEKTAKWS